MTPLVYLGVFLSRGVGARLAWRHTVRKSYRTRGPAKVPGVLYVPVQTKRRPRVQSGRGSFPLKLTTNDLDDVSLRGVGGTTTTRTASLTTGTRVQNKVKERNPPTP